jgi:hypothetical protein
VLKQQPAGLEPSPIQRLPAAPPERLPKSLPAREASREPLTRYWRLAMPGAGTLKLDLSRSVQRPAQPLWLG